MDSCRFPFVALLGEDLKCVNPADGWNDPMQDALLFEERVRSEIAALSEHASGSKLLQPRQMNSQNCERHFMCDPIVDVLSLTRIDIGEPSTSGGIG